MDGYQGSLKSIAGERTGARRVPEFFYGYMLTFILIVYPISLVTKYKFFFITGILSALALILGLLLTGRITVKKFDGVRKVYVFFFLPLASTLWALYPGETLWNGSIFLIFLLVFYSAEESIVRTGKRFLYTVFTIVPYICLALFLIIIAVYGTVRSNSLQMTEAVGTFCNTAPALVELCIPYLAVRLLAAKSEKKVFATGALLSSLSVILLSLSRGAYLLLAVNVSLLIMLSGRSALSKFRTFFMIFVVLLTAGSLVVAAAGYDNTVGKVVDRFAESELINGGLVKEPGILDPSKASSDYVRAVMFYEGYRLLSSLPVTGIGFENFANYIELKYGFKVVSHNLVVTLWGELGIGGLILFSWIVFSAFRRVLRSRRLAYGRDTNVFNFYSATAVSLTVAILHGQLQPQLTNPMLYVVIAAAFSSPARISEDVLERDTP